MWLLDQELFGSRVRWRFAPPSTAGSLGVLFPSLWASSRLRASRTLNVASRCFAKRLRRPYFLAKKQLDLLLMLKFSSLRVTWLFPSLRSRLTGLLNLVRKSILQLIR